jgi:hypothetical protein
LQLRVNKLNEVLPWFSHLTFERSAAVDALELWVDAWLYWNRAVYWQSILWNRPVDEGGVDLADADFLRAATRYVAAGSDRILKRSRELRPFLEEAGKSRREGRRALLQRLAASDR